MSAPELRRHLLLLPLIVLFAHACEVCPSGPSGCKEIPPYEINLGRYEGGRSSYYPPVGAPSGHGRDLERRPRLEITTDHRVIVRYNLFNERVTETWRVVALTIENVYE